MDIQDPIASHIDGWYNNNNTIKSEQDSDVTLPMLRLQMNSMPHRTRVTSNRSSPYTGNVKVLLDLDNQHLASATDDLPLNLTVSSLRPSVIHYPNESSLIGNEIPSDVDEHFRRSLNGFYKRRRRSEQLRRRGNLLSPPPQVQIPSQNTSIVVSCPPQPGSRIRRTWAPETTPTTPPPPPPYSAYKTSTPTSSAISSSSSFAGTYKKTGRRRASCIPDLPRHRVVRPDSPELPSCVVSLSESAAVSVSGSVDDHFAKSLGNAKWTELKYTPLSSPTSPATPTDATRKRTPITVTEMVTTSDSHDTSTNVNQSRGWLNAAVETQDRSSQKHSYPVSAKPESSDEAFTAEFTAQTNVCSFEVSNPPAYIQLMEQRTPVAMETEIPVDYHPTDTEETSMIPESPEIDPVDEHFRKALGCQTWSWLTAKS